MEKYQFISISFLNFACFLLFKVYNRSYAEGKIQEAEKYRATLEEKFPEEAKTYLTQEYPALLEDVNKTIHEFYIQKDIDEAKKRCETLWKDFETNLSRFPDRSETALKNMEAHIETLKKLSPLTASNWKVKYDEGKKIISEKASRDLLEKAASSTKTPLSMADNELTRYGRPDQVIRYLDEALKYFEKNFEDNPAILDIDSTLVEEYRKTFYDKYMLIQKGLKELSIKIDLKKDGDNMVQQLTNAKLYFNSNRSQAQGYYESGLQRFEDFVSNLTYIDHPLRSEYIEKFNTQKKNYEDFAADKDLKDRIRKETGDCLQNISNADAYLIRSPSQALEYIEKAKLMAEDIALDPVLSPLPEISEFFKKYEEKLAAFESKYEKQVVGELMRNAKSNVQNNLNFVKSYPHDFSRQLDFVTIARDKLIEIQTDSLLMRQPEMIEFVKSAEVEIENIEKQIQDRIAENEAKESISNIQLRFIWAKGALSGHNLSRAKECVEEADNLFETLNSFTSLAEHPQVVQYSSEFPAERDALLKEINSRILEEELRNAKSSVTTALAGLDSYIQREDFANALNILDKGQDKVIELEATFAVEAKEFIEEYSSKIISKRDEILEGMLRVESKKAIEKVETLIKNANIYLDSHRPGQAMEYLEQSIDAKSELEFNSQLFDRSEVQSYLSGFDAKELEFREKFAAKESQEKIKNYISNATTNLNNAKIYFDSYRYSQSKEYLEKAKDLQAEIVSDSEVSSVTQIKEFLDKFEKDIFAFESECQQKMSEEGDKQRMGSVTTALRNAEAHFPNYPTQCLTHLQQAKDLLDDIRFESSTTITPDWISNMDNQIEQFEIQYNEKILADEIKKEKGNIETLIQSSSAYINSSKQTALEHLEKAQDRLSDFISKFSSESTFISEIGKKIQEKVDEINKKIQDEELKSKKESITTTFNSAKAYVSSHREAQALQLLESVTDKLIDLESYPNEKTFIENTTKEVDNLQKSILETAFNEEVKRKIDICNLHLKNAEIYMDRSQKERAIEYLEQSEEASNELMDEKYIGLKTVDDFFTTFTTSIKNIKEKFNTIIYAQEVKKLKEDILSTLSTSKIYFSSHRQEQALEYLNQVKEKFESFIGNENYTLNESAFIEDARSKIDAFDNEFTETVYKNQVVASIRKLDSNFSQAQNYLKYNAFDRALESFENSKADAEALLQYKGHSLAKERLSQFENEKEQFGKEYSEKALKKDVSKLSNNIKSILHVGKIMLEQKLTSKVFEQLEKAQVDLGNVNQLAKNLVEVQELFNLVEEFRTKVAVELLQDEANKELRKGKREFEKVSVFVKRGLKKQSIEHLKEFANEFRSLLEESSNFVVLPEVKEFKKQVFDVASELGLKESDLFTAEKKEENTVSEGTDKLFAQFLDFGDIKLETIAMSTSISSKVFNSVKSYNTSAGKANQNVRKFFRDVKSLSIENGADITHEYSYEDLFRDSKDLRKSYDSIPSDAKEDENAKKILASVEKFENWLKTVQEKIKEIKVRQAALARIKNLISYINELNAKGNSFLEGGTIPAQANFISLAIEAVTGSMSIQLFDYELFITAYEKAVDGKSLVTQFAEQFQGFPANYFNNILDTLSQNALKGHVKHCMRGFTEVSSSKRSLYYRALRRFPLARKYALKELDDQKHNEKVYDPSGYIDDKVYAFEDPFEGQTFSDAIPENEEDYLPTFDVIQPADPSVPEGNSPHESENPMYWNKMKQNHTGEIIFSKEEIDTNEKREIFTNEFTYGTDEIFGRATWRNCIKNFAIAKDKKTGKYLYPSSNNSEFIIELLYFVKIDGNKIQTYDRYHTFFFDTENSKCSKEPGSSVNFYSWNQSMKVNIMKNNVNFRDSYQRTSVLRFNREFSKLEPGKHNVEIELCYLIRSKNENRNANTPKFPTFTTKISHPIAKGSFTINIPQGATMLNLLPKTTSQLPNASEIEAVTLKMMRESSQWGKRVPKTENIISTWSTSQIYVTRYHWLTEKPIEWGTDFTALIYRNPEQGWTNEQLALFYLATYSEQEKKEIPPCVGIGVASNVTFEPDLVPESVLNGVNRYSGNWKDIFNRISDADKKRYFEEPWTTF